jgi:hypothetical protein
MPVTSITMIAPASLRSDRARHRVGIAARLQIGISDHLHRNQQLCRATVEPLLNPQFSMLISPALCS